MNGLKPIKIPSAKEKVASELRKAILSRKMKEGEILSLDSVATQLNVSITPVREAFQILARDGLIKLRQNKGAIVLGITDTYIREHYQLRAILESACAGLAAEVCSFSSSHFMRWFRQMTGQSFIAFLNEYRLNTAAEALQTTDETVLTIASRCGFENLSYFNRIFKAHFGITPRDYRKR